MCGVNFPVSYHVVCGGDVSVLGFLHFFVRRSFIICVVFRVFIMRGEPEDTFMFSSTSSLSTSTLYCVGGWVLEG